MNHNLSTIVGLLLVNQILAMPLVRQGTFNLIVRSLAILVAICLFVIDPA